MNQVGKFNYAEIDGVQVFQMPYTVTDISFVACLTKYKTGVKKLLIKLKQSSFIKRTLSELKSTTVDVSIPTLDISTTTDLKQVLSDAGVRAIFDLSTAGLSGILENPVIFNADHPFIYYIVLKYFIVFAGVYASPQ